MYQEELKEYLRFSRWPTMWCPGCGLGIMQRVIAEAMKESNLDHTNTTIISGIGCTGRTAGYFNFDSIHGLHGRAVCLAEGVKAVRPDLNVVVVSGDGDIFGIGGNHLLHSSRRNANLKVIVNVNDIYGLTGGQMSPCTPKGVKTVTSPQGSPYDPFNAQGLITSNAHYFYARSSVWHQPHLKKCIKEMMSWHGFALLEVRDYCIENNGRRLGFKNPHEMLMQIKETYKIKSDLQPGQQLAQNELGIMTR
ncbi:hypothetical protein AUK40_06760 [Candidatus Wirthbacteria bacterium CG2_30_54_11]|uniref:Thiamine pyrophosphate enzyme TPP-binding domain-containing protein n=1 Tax=Candidatus Wirthbacteria bacterium CG2_30_54_11 TaxID=1817892 RepID=A0A1J5IJI7_9BACT|nr:MAG: hypothetical protein AUK40_06760 [Candidatus Wirthbacteria bacterium CG2_30_54_11]